MRLGETLSSDTLFHFTGERAWLENIIENGFFPRYCTEDFSMFSSIFGSETKSFEFGVPMICFCDIPLSKVKEHTSVYKGYGIGCTKAWGIERGVTPLMYVKPTSETVQGIQNALMALNPLRTVNEIDLSALGIVHDHLLRLIKYVKPYEGKFEHSGQVFDNKRFYDEREWRYIPKNNFGTDGYLPSWIGKDTLSWGIQEAKRLFDLNIYTGPSTIGDVSWIHKYLKESSDLLTSSDAELVESVYQKVRLELNTKIESMPEMALPIDPLTIKYIIVEKEEDVEPIADVLDRKFRAGYSPR
jgi:hypothetical protein